MGASDIPHDVPRSATPVNRPGTSAAPGFERRPPSEYAVEEPRLRRLAALPADDPERAALRDQLIRTFLPVGEHIAAKYGANWPNSREDLRQVAAVGVINAVDRWDPDRAGGDVLGFVVPSVRGEVLRYIRDRAWAVRIPRRLNELSVAIDRATTTLTNQLGRAPRPSELARHLDADVEEIIDALHADADRRTTPIDAPSSGDERTLAERLGEPNHDMEAVDDIVTLRPLLERLPERERRIIELRFFHDRSQTQIADEVGISQMHVSRLLARTLADLRHALIEEPDAARSSRS